ncbi:hypothetical protein QJS10_CPB12g01788 [Acorus calamus]|uniref:Uncharacterized protein n=1 Tax=Acorus calamus TaxID=4465 RepID=A0AAV9DN32_ACOCL|nr:hypothetical protein QJS10_CPB12g01788 [Acorus calamus]
MWLKLPMTGHGLSPGAGSLGGVRRRSLLVRRRWYEWMSLKGMNIDELNMEEIFGLSMSKKVLYPNS